MAGIPTRQAVSPGRDDDHPARHFGNNGPATKSGPPSRTPRATSLLVTGCLPMSVGVSLWRMATHELMVDRVSRHASAAVNESAMARYGNVP